MSLLLSCLLLGVASSRVSLEPSLTFHQETPQWKQGARASPDAMMTLHLMMRHEADDVQLLHDTLMAVSDPRHDSYGKHLNQAQVAALAPISDAKINAVKSFLTDAVSLSFNAPHNDIVTAKLFVQDVERLLHTTVHTFAHKQRTGVTLLRATTEYTVPSSLHASVSIVGDLVALPRLPELKNRTVAVGNLGHNWPNACPTEKSFLGCDGLVTPAVLKHRYNVPNGSTGMEAPANQMAVAEFEGQFYSKTDLDIFSKACNVNVSVDTYVGKYKDVSRVEGNLDVQYIGGVSDGISLTFVYSDGYSLLNWMTQVSTMTNPPQIHSVSYGNDEANNSPPYMQSCNTQFMKAGAQGISVLFSSGSHGVCGREICFGRFNPGFPAASPYITAVGGTDFVRDEAAWTGSGGGFSDTFGIPSWQADALKAYKANPDAKIPKQSLWNNTGRGFPDVSALAGPSAAYCVIYNNYPQGVYGTSAASPVLAAIFARVNGLRLKAGKPVLGFLNPFIYQNAAAFNDITSGCNPGNNNIHSDVDESCEGEGFTATKGWDAATGWGTPNFAALSKAAMGMFE